MINLFESTFHKQYVGGAGEVVEKPMIPRESTILIGHSYEEILAEYRRYVGDSSAELPGEVLD